MEGWQAYPFFEGLDYPFNFKIEGFCWYPDWEPHSFPSEVAMRKIKEIMKEIRDKEKL